LLMCGLVVDGGAQAEAARRAQSAAAMAARSALDSTATARLAGAEPEVGKAVAVARQVLAAHGVEGDITLRAGQVEVTTTAQVETVFLSLIGINTLRATGSATAELQTG
ncbi:MAG: hypothetical protein KIT69_10435, partial [Propionibacteriaceae bacterium]|nr:hypothetical protein [Propionibacteriaceae bacterium]